MTATKPQVREKPILFSGPMIRAILAGTKSQTRRVINPQPVESQGGRGGCFKWGYEIGAPKSTSPRSVFWHHPTWMKEQGSAPLEEYCPYGQVGSHLWCRETWQQYKEHSESQSAVIKSSIARMESGQVKDIVAEVGSWPFPPNGERRVLYAADFGDWAYNVDSDLKPWRSPIFMPRWASRITLEITGVKVERLQEISTTDIIAEGVLPDDSYLGSANRYRHAWIAGWNKINGKRPGCRWEDNPWVFAVSFRRLNP